MPWVRIDENAMDHPKIGGLSDGAFRLWVQGLAFCQKFLTDGYISDPDVRAFRAYSPKRRSLLIGATLWHASESGVRVHDFLDWNESREHVMTVRKLAKDRLKKFREKRVSERVANALLPSGVVCSEDLSSEGRERGAGKTTPSERAGNFIQWYEDAYDRLMGVGYMGTQKDYQVTLQMVEKFSDADLRDAALVWFGQDDDWACTGTRTIVKFASRVSGCLHTIKASGIA